MEADFREAKVLRGVKMRNLSKLITIDHVADVAVPASPTLPGSSIFSLPP